MDIWKLSDQPVARIDRFVTPLGEIDLIASPLDPAPPLCTNLAVPLFQTTCCRYSYGRICLFT